MVESSWLVPVRARRYFRDGAVVSRVGDIWLALYCNGAGTTSCAGVADFMNVTACLLADSAAKS